MSKPEIMTVQEVADFLRISERTVYEWATQGVIPCGKLGTTWRFKRSEVERWVDEQLSSQVKKNVTFSPVSLKDILNPAHVMLLETSNKDEALMAIVDKLHRTGAIKDREAVAEGIFQREKLMSTGIGLGIGIPHVRMSGIDELIMAAAVSTQDITDYESLDGKPVRLIFMILAGKDRHTLHIKTMAAISSRLRNEILREMILHSHDVETIYSLLTEGGRP
jgi:PTS system nitrogen regulatory IIA component